MKTLHVAFAALLTAALPVAAKDYYVHAFKKIQLTDKFWSEGAHAADFNRDGAMDVVSGPFWYAGPGFTMRHEFREAKATFQLKQPNAADKTIEGYEGGLGVNNAYSDDFFTFTDDFNQDGWMDILIIGMPGEPAFWFQNPKNAAGPWPRHQAFDSVDNESPTFADLTGDGRPEIVCNTKGFFGYAEPNWAEPMQPWRFHPVTPNKNYHKYTHGIGVGDVNGDHRNDLLEKDGWWEAPASLAGDPVWAFHAYEFCPATLPGVPVGGAQLYAYDVNGDKRNDVITCLASHGFGLVWYENVLENGQITFRRHVIMNSAPADNPYGVKFSQPHAIDLVDMDGDGLLDLVTGKRFWAHGSAGDPEPNEPAVLYWFKLTRPQKGSAEYVPYLIDNNSGVGTQVLAVDLNGDKAPDVVVGNKKGTFVFLQERQKVSQDAWTQAQPKPAAAKP